MYSKLLEHVIVLTVDAVILYGLAHKVMPQIRVGFRNGVDVVQKSFAKSKQGAKYVKKKIDQRIAKWRAAAALRAVRKARTNNASHEPPMNTTSVIQTTSFKPSGRRSASVGGTKREPLLLMQRKIFTRSQIPGSVP